MSQSQRVKQRQSQPRPGTSSQVDEDDYDELAASQISPNKNLTNQEHAHHVANVVKYILAADFSNVPIPKAAISKAINCHNRNFKSIFEAAVNVLKDTFGYAVSEVDGKLIVYNMIKNDSCHLEYEEDIANNYTLLFIILGHIFMSGDQCSQGSLISFLISLGIINDGNMKSDVFGDISQIMSSNFIKEKYLAAEKTENSEANEFEYKWGARAELELSRRTILEFMSKIYRGRDIKTWPQQYEKMIKSEERR